VDKAEAGKILSTETARLRQRSYSQLRRSVESRDVETLEVRGTSGTVYQLEINFFWDNEPRGTIRVLVSIDDGGWRAFSPITEDFILAPDGSFVGEETPDVR
jgi:hypothetical protein